VSRFEGCCLDARRNGKAARRVAFSRQIRDDESTQGIPPQIPAACKRSRGALLFLHGNGENRADLRATRKVKAFTRRDCLDVVTLDYRGFGDSEGSPTELGMVDDAVLVYEWMRKAHKGRLGVRRRIVGARRGPP